MSSTNLGVGNAGDASYVSIRVFDSPPLNYIQAMNAKTWYIPRLCRDTYIFPSYYVKEVISYDAERGPILTVIENRVP